MVILKVCYVQYIFIYFIEISVNIILPFVYFKNTHKRVDMFIHRNDINCLFGGIDLSNIYYRRLCSNVRQTRREH